jgi:hypothetical protein
MAKSGKQHSKLKPAGKSPAFKRPSPGSSEPGRSTETSEPGPSAETSEPGPSA